MSKKAKTVRVVVAVAVLCGLVLAYYAYLSDRQTKRINDTKLTEQDELMLMNLDGSDYPKDPVQVCDLYSRFLKCIYNEKLSGDALSDMVTQMRKLYADKFAGNEGNSKNQQVDSITSELSGSGKNEKRITNYTVGELSQVEYGTVDGNKSAMCDVNYTVRNDNNYSRLTESYVLIQDEKQRWKILGWQENDNSTIGNSDSDKE